MDLAGRHVRTAHQTAYANRSSSSRASRGFDPAFSVIGVATVIGLLIAPGALAMGTSPWENAQVGLTYPLYRPAVTLGLKRTAFKLLPCGAGMDESVSVTYGNAYKTPSSFGKVKGFSIEEGYPQICSNPGTAKYVAIRTVNRIKIRISVYCDPEKFASCSLGTGLTNGYVLQWTQPYAKGESLEKRTRMFVDSSKLTLADTLKVAQKLKRV